MERKFPCSMRTLFVDDEFTFPAVIFPSFSIHIFFYYSVSNLDSDSISIIYQQTDTARIIAIGFEIPHPYFSEYMSKYLFGKIKQQLTAITAITSIKISTKITAPYMHNFSSSNMICALYLLYHSGFSVCTGIMYCGTAVLQPLPTH